MDFGLVDPEGVFHYFTVTGGSIDKTIRVSESGMSQFTVRMNLMGKPNLKYTMQRLKPTCWIAILAVIMHFILTILLLRQENKHKE